MKNVMKFSVYLIIEFQEQLQMNAKAWQTSTLVAPARHEHN